MTPASEPVRTKGRRLLECGAALALLSLLGGCFAGAAIAVPALTAVGLVAGRKEIRAATPRPEPARAQARSDLAASGVQLTTLTELPPPSGAFLPVDAAPAWTTFLTYASQRAGALTADGAAESVLLAPEAVTTMRPIRRPCEDRTPGILIDLDAGDAAFDGRTGGIAPLDLVTGLDRLRRAGVVVLWISRSSANQVAEIGDALLRAGLDPTGRDPLLLIRSEDHRKQTLREEAGRDVCLIAIAGDERGDFDELFDYLRNPASAAELDTLLGDGWFLVPPPLAAP